MLRISRAESDWMGMVVEVVYGFARCMGSSSQILCLLGVLYKMFRKDQPVSKRYSRP